MQKPAVVAWSSNNRAFLRFAVHASTPARLYLPSFYELVFIFYFFISQARCKNTRTENQNTRPCFSGVLFCAKFLPSLNCASECFIYYGGTYRHGWKFEYFNRRYDSVTCFFPALTTPGAQFLSAWKRHRQRSDEIKSSLLSQISNRFYHFSRSLFEVELLVLKIWGASKVSTTVCKPSRSSIARQYAPRKLIGAAGVSQFQPALSDIPFPH